MFRIMTINHGKVTFYTKIAYSFSQIIFLVSIVYSPRDKQIHTMTEVHEVVQRNNVLPGERLCS